MIETTVAARVVRPVTEQERVEQLNAQRTAIQKRMTFCDNQRRYVALRNPDEAAAWEANYQSLAIDLELIEGDLKHYATPRDERYAEVRAQMRHEDQTRAVTEHATDWEACK